MDELWRAFALQVRFDPFPFAAAAAATIQPLSLRKPPFGHTSPKTTSLLIGIIQAAGEEEIHSSCG